MGTGHPTLRCHLPTPRSVWGAPYFSALEAAAEASGIFLSSRGTVAGSQVAFPTNAGVRPAPCPRRGAWRALGEASAEPLVESGPSGRHTRDRKPEVGPGSATEGRRHRTDGLRAARRGRVSPGRFAETQTRVREVVRQDGAGLRPDLRRITRVFYCQRRLWARCVDGPGKTLGGSGSLGTRSRALSSLSN